MAGKTFKEPKPSPNDQAGLDILAQAGFVRDPETGQMVHQESFQGGDDTTNDPGNPFGSEGTVETVHTVIPGQDRLEVGEDDPLPTEEVAEESAPPQKPIKDGAQTEEGLAKRESDAREAQRAMGKAQAKLEATLAQVNKKFGDLDEQIQRLSTLQVTSGGIPTGLNPADAATVTQYREDYPEAVGVMEALTAPLYQIIGDLREQVKAVVQNQGQFFSKMKEEEVFSGIYQKIPKEKVASLTTDPVFLDWLANKPPVKGKYYVDVLNNTSRYTSEEALDVFKDFSRDTGVDLGLNGKPARAAHPMDTAPRVRTGSALPPPPSPQPETPTEDTPLSLTELATFGRDLQNARTEREREVLRKRFAASTINIDGRNAPQFA